MKKEIIIAQGHRNIKSTHKTTLEITKDSFLSQRGNCIIATKADKSLVDLKSDFKKAITQPNVVINITIQAGSENELVRAFGDSRLLLRHPSDIVIRKSDFICNRTLAVRADKSAFDLSRKLIQKLKNPKQTIKITLSVEK